MDLALIDRNASRAAGRFKRKCWWVDYSEVYQVASLAQIEAYDRFDASWGRPREAYLWRAALFAARRHVHKASAPVSASHRTEVLIGAYRAPLDESAAAETPTPEQLCVMGERARRVRSRVVALFGESALSFALGLITDEWAPREVAKANGVSVSLVYATQQRMIRAMLADEELYELWKESV